MNRPPKFLWRLLVRCSPSNRPDILGDFEEWYQDLVEEKGKNYANRTWFFHCLTMVKLKLITKAKTVKNQNKFSIMIGLNFKIARRNLLKNKIYSLINVLGLSVGLAACSLIFTYVRDELSYDQHFKDYDRIYRIAGEYNQGGSSSTRSAETTWMLLPAMQGQIDENIVYTRLDFGERLVRIGNKHYWEPNSLIVDSTFFDVFETPVIQGNLVTALDDPFGAVIDQTLARKYFGDRNPVGQSIQVNGNTYSVNAVIRDLPANTHFQSSLFLAMRGIVNTYPNWVLTNNSGTSHLTYAKLPAQMRPEVFEEEMNQYLAERWGIDEDQVQNYFVQPISDIHLQSHLTGEVGRNSTYTTIYIFIATSIIILLLACINYINLSIAGSMERSKEVGLKKVLGASRGSQVFQFQAESILIGFMATLVAVLLLEMALPFFNQVTEKNLALTLVDDLIFGSVLFAITLLISLFTGTFPAYFLLRLSTVQSLAGAMTIKGSKGLSGRNVLVALQFFIAGVLVASTFIIMYQIRFMQNKDLGIETDQLIMVPFQTFEGFTRYEVYKESLLSNSDILSVTASTSRITGRIGGWRGYQLANSDENISCPTVIVSHDFFETLGAEMVSGRAFSKEYPADFTQSFVINEAAQEFFQLDDAVGATLKGWAFTGAQWTKKNASVIGVVKDFHFASLHDRIRPIVFSLSSEITMPLNWMTVKVNHQNIDGALSKMEAAWNELNPERPFRYQFVNEELEEHYSQERTFLKVFTAFSVLSIFIGCLGLFGLTAFMMKRRTKEIGIRKVLGASFLSLLTSLSQGFIKLVLLATILGTPVTIWLMIRWLENFEYQVGISWWPFALTCLAALVIAMVSILYHSVKVAHANPVDSIRYE